MNNRTRKNKTLLSALIWVAILLCAVEIFQSKTSYESFMWVLLCGAVGLAGYSLGATRKDDDLIPTEPVAPTKKQTVTETITSKNQSSPLHLPDVIDELTLLHTSNDLYERYQCFIRLAEDGLQQALGPCCVTLWCLDHDQQHLVECLIPQTAQQKNANRSSPIDSAPPPYRISLDCPVIRYGLETERPYLANASDKMQNYLNHNALSLHSDACIPLYREYGQPMIVSIRQNNPSTSPYDADAFYRMAELIKLFWEQLQAANQRQWQSEHNETDKVLREQVFLDHAQKQAIQAIRQDELFCLVVVTIRGFRSMFAGQSRKWRLLSSLTAQTLNHCLQDAKQDFLLGKMADDVFAILLHRSDAFITRAVMESVLADLGRHINNAPETQNLDLAAIELQWTLADHQDYSHSISEMLDKIYGGLFPPHIDRPVYEYRIDIEKSLSEAKT